MKWKYSQTACWMFSPGAVQLGTDGKYLLLSYDQLKIAPLTVERTQDQPTMKSGRKSS